MIAYVLTSVQGVDPFPDSPRCTKHSEYEHSNTDGKSLLIIIAIIIYL